MSKLIVIDGPDACGKETQSGLLKENLEKQGREVGYISFPRYDADESVFVKNYLKGSYGQNPQEIDPKTASYFYALDRYDYFKKHKMPQVLVADRYTTSNMIHQGTKFTTDSDRKAFNRWLEELEYEQLEIPKPDLVFFLDLPYEVSHELAKERKGDIHENSEDHERRAYETAKKTAKENGWIIIDCLKEGKLRSKEDISREIFEEVVKHV